MNPLILQRKKKKNKKTKTTYLSTSEFVPEPKFPKFWSDVPSTVPRKCRV